MVDIIYSLIKMEFVKYGMVGSIGFLVHLATLYLLTDIAGLWYLASAIIAIVTAALCNYILNYHWTFKEKKTHINNIYLGYFQYLLSRGFTEGLYLGLLFLAVDIGGLNYLFSAAIIQIVTAIVGYVIAVKWIWRKRGEPEEKRVFEVYKYY